MMEQHNSPKLFSCPECPQNFSRRDHLDRHVKSGRHIFRITCEYCKQDLEFKSHTEMSKHYTKWGTTRSNNTCVNVMKMREADPDYDKFECSFCKEIVPFKLPTSGHTIRIDPEEPSKMTCINKLKARKFLICPCCGEKLSTSPSEWKKHYGDRLSSLTDCNTRLAWREKGDFIRGRGPLLIKGILVPQMTAHMPLDHPCHRDYRKYPLNPCLPLPCWTQRYIRSLLGNPLHFLPVEKK